MFLFFSLILLTVSSFFFLTEKQTGGPLLLMELAFLLRGVGTEVVWITNQKPEEADEVTYSLENKMLDRGVQVSFLLLHFQIQFF